MGQAGFFPGGVFLFFHFLVGIGAAGAAPFTIVIDPGHGGSDLGTVHRSGQVQVAEKDVTLMLSKEAANELRKLGFRVLLTRESDRDVPLPARTALANRARANVFISLHLNSEHAIPSGATGAEGVETFILNNTSDESSRRLARLENALVTPESLQDVAGPADVALILKDLRLDANLAESKRLACSIQQNLVQSTSGRMPKTRTARDRGVKQALFYVLLGADMPSTLVEVGFLSSAWDRGLILSRQGRKAVGRAIATAVDDYRRNRRLSTCKIN